MWLFLAVSWVFLQFVIVVFPDHTHLLFFDVVYRTMLKRLSLSALLQVIKIQITRLLNIPISLRLL